MHAQEKSEKTNRQTHAHCQKDILTHSLNPSHTLHPLPHIPPPPPPSLAPLPLSVVSGWDDLSGEKSSVTMETGAWGERKAERPSKTAPVCRKQRLTVVTRPQRDRSGVLLGLLRGELGQCHVPGPTPRAQAKRSVGALHTVAKNIQIYLQLLLLSLLEFLIQPCLWRRLGQTSCSSCRHPSTRTMQATRLLAPYWKIDMDRTKMITDS